jgi:hypothetical protein
MTDGATGRELWCFNNTCRRWHLYRFCSGMLQWDTESDFGSPVNLSVQSIETAPMEISRFFLPQLFRLPLVHWPLSNQNTSWAGQKVYLSPAMK